MGDAMKEIKSTKTKRRRLKRGNVLDKQNVKVVVWYKEMNKLMLILIQQQRRKEKKFKKERGSSPPKQNQSLLLQRNILQ